MVTAFLIFIVSHSPAHGYIVDRVNGNDNNNGETVNDPFQTITRCIEALTNPGDECQIRSGYYHESVTISGLKGTKEAPFKIVGYQEERPVWDGTVTIQPQEWTYNLDTRICSAKIDRDIFALFYKNDLLTPARWPNAKWSDKTVFDRDYWRPDGCCEASERGTIVDDALADANLNFTGALAILNVGSFQTWVREVLSYEMGNNNFTYYDDFGDNINFVHKQYYMESKLEFLDAYEEWFYDKDTKMLYLIMPENDADTCPHTDAGARILRGRTLDNIVEIIDSNHVVVSNISFYGANIIASNNVDSITFDSLIFKFPSSSHRMLRSETIPRQTTINGNDNQVINCTFIGAEGPALYFDGDNMLIHNSDFSYNDWVGQGNLGTIWAKERNVPSEFSQNNLYYNGVAHGYRSAGYVHSNIMMNHVEGQCWGLIQNDGAGIHLQVPSQPGSYIVNNWVHTSPKMGIRFDGGGTPNCNERSTGCGGYVSYNVAWNIIGREAFLKGDNHTVLNNVGWDDSSEDCTFCVPAEFQGATMNTKSIVVNNGAVLGGSTGGGGAVVENNYDAQDVKDQMVDADNYDFRPVPGGGFITPDGGEIIGAYTLEETSLMYWIPGRKLYKASFPIPPDQGTVKAERSDVICNTGYMADRHDFYFGEFYDEVEGAGKDDDAFQMTLNGDENIFALPSLSAGKEYYWRVDARRGDYVYKGDVWSFVTV